MAGAEVRPSLVLASTLTAFSVVLFAGTLYVSYRTTIDYTRHPCDTIDPSKSAVYPDGTQEGLQPRFGMPICVNVPNLSAASDGKTEAQPLILFLDGEPFDDLTGRIVDKTKNLVAFTLNRTTKNGEIWDRVIGYPPADGSVELRVGVGTSKQGEFPRGDKVSTLHILMGVSGGFYLGFKAKET